MGLSIGTHQSCPIHTEHHMELLECHIVEQHVVRALQKRGINRKYGQHPLLCHAGAHGDGVTLRDAHVIEPVVVPLRKAVQSGARLHGGSDRADAPVFVGQFRQALAEHGGIVGFQCGRNALCQVECPDAVVVFRRILSGLVALSLCRTDVEQYGAVQRVRPSQQAGQIL